MFIVDIERAYIRSFRLSEDPNIHVAVLEAGGYVSGDSRVCVPGES